MYQGFKALDNREVNYFTMNLNEAKNYGENIRAVEIKLQNPLLKKSDEYWNLREEFKEKKGYYAEILNNSAEGLIHQLEFFNFLKTKGYDGITFLHEGLFFYPSSDSQYVITFNHENFKEISNSDIELAAGYWMKQLSKHASENDSRVYLHNINEVLKNYKISSETDEYIVSELQSRGLYGVDEQVWDSFFHSGLRKSVQCSASTKLNKLCTRKTLNGNGLCWQHNK